jgi:hypothetical protein
LDECIPVRWRRRRGIGRSGDGEVTDPVACDPLRARPARPRHRRATEQRDELAAFQPIELHAVPASLGRIAGYQFRGGYATAILQLDSRLRCTSEVWCGSFSTELVWTKRSLRSAMPPIATEFTRHDESSPSATSRLVQCSEKAQGRVLTTGSDEISACGRESRLGRRLCWFTDDDERRPVFRFDQIGLLRMIDHCQHGLLQR